MRILIDGLDLTGKSTLVRELTSTLNERGIPARDHRWMLSRIQPFAARLRRLPRVRQPDSGFITAALLGPGYLLDGLLVRLSPPDRSDQVIIQEGYADRCVAFGMASGPHLAACLAVRWPRLLAPFDLAIYLHAPVETRAKRLAIRDDADANDRRTVEDPSFAATFNTTLVRGVGRRHTHLRIYDTSLRSAADIASEIAAEVAHRIQPTPVAHPQAA
ncbi:hypothetical protein [Nonomuraea aridisoli]|uniref:Thymidylate kinase n=1 Tax=Nonomuraea aridisoli TaxID=2070368 RepID=A0A2W2E5Q8_9ACTN|nr:hypothetical protein [Nonomuraea aridisoli]PZG04927.1 hypothetical protein C1J01_44065 [Nonomuraea aridisoli]